MKKQLVFISWLWLSTLSVLYAQQEKVYTFYFKTDSSTLNTTETAKLNDLLQEMDRMEVRGVSIYGYTDDRGSKAYNNVLSVNRADFIKKTLLKYGLDNQIISVVLGKGKLPLTHPEKTAFQRAFNRRVDVQIEYVVKKTKPPAGQIFNLETLKVGDKLVIEDILFQANRHQILPESYPALDKLVRTLKTKQQYHIDILGHICCNPPGKDIQDYDTGEFDLSLARAKEVYNYLILNGINANRLAYKGMMANFPLGKGEKYDRRVEIQIIAIDNLK